MADAVKQPTSPQRLLRMSVLKEQFDQLQSDWVQFSESRPTSRARSRSTSRRPSNGDETGNLKSVPEEKGGQGILDNVRMKGIAGGAQKHAAGSPASRKQQQRQTDAPSTPPGARKIPPAQKAPSRSPGPHPVTSPHGTHAAPRSVSAPRHAAQPQAASKPSHIPGPAGPTAQPAAASSKQPSPAAAADQEDIAKKASKPKKWAPPPWNDKFVDLPAKPFEPEPPLEAEAESMPSFTAAGVGSKGRP
eukprot:CAMPEP_0202919668 /NCGR_PEP_ID=MMETSP1392-20130828/76428_1 /ASSEMBLY_ACC=CAM_ASM_000868 /TAXON_ID=225041 /ORGANISM="Chlamydomonas chlamydogama, Strain SAG 11-48b" /LENGTH=246 /DNA_ID=CAMNT_0049613123 /DNA_START=247 /DNA_END=983 /DNA_ORIENTATION=+